MEQSCFGLSFTPPDVDLNRFEPHVARQDAAAMRIIALAMQLIAMRAPQPDRCVDVIERALTEKAPHARHGVGNDIVTQLVFSMLPARERSTDRRADQLRPPNGRGRIRWAKRATGAISAGEPLTGNFPALTKRVLAQTGSLPARHSSSAKPQSGDSSSRICHSKIGNDSRLNIAGISVFARFKAKPGQEDRVRLMLLEMIGPTRQESASIGYALHAAKDDPTLFLLYEQWQDAAGLDAHVQQPYFAEMRRRGSHTLSRRSRMRRTPAARSSLTSFILRHISPRPST
jgi:quinol monooxygenase YgiN